MGICSMLGHTLCENIAPIDMLVIGPLARSAGDLAIGLSAIAGLDDIDLVGFACLAAAEEKRLDEYRVSILIDDDTVPLTRDVVALSRSRGLPQKQQGEGENRCEARFRRRRGAPALRHHAAATPAWQTDAEFDATS